MLELVQKVQPEGAGSSRLQIHRKLRLLLLTYPKSLQLLLLPTYQDVTILSLFLRCVCVCVSNAALNSGACDLLVAISPAGEGAATSVRS